MNMLVEHVGKCPPKKTTLQFPDGRKILRSLVFTTLRGAPIRSKRFRAQYWKLALRQAGLPGDLQMMHLRHLRDLRASSDPQPQSGRRFPPAHHDPDG